MAEKELIFDIVVETNKAVESITDKLAGQTVNRHGALYGKDDGAIRSGGIDDIHFGADCRKSHGIPS